MIVEQFARQLAEYGKIKNGGVGERLKPAVLKNKTPVRYQAENSTKSLCRPQDSVTFFFLDLRGFCSFCATFSDNFGDSPARLPAAHGECAHTHISLQSARPTVS
jgi:hypothetical protein